MRPKSCGGEMRFDESVHGCWRGVNVSGLFYAVPK